MKNKLSKRLYAIIKLINKDSVVLDVGTDHGHIPIFLVENNISKKSYGSDISKNVVERLKKKIKSLNLEEKINIFENDGLKNLDVKYDTLILAGMGFHTIKTILNHPILPETIIIQSNSKIDEVRSLLNELDYKIETEFVIYENNKYYPIIKYIKGNEKLSYFHLKFGKSNNKKYYKYLRDHHYKLMLTVPLKNKFKYVINIVLLQIKIFL